MTSLLIVDDDVVFCEVLGASLRERGFEVRAAHRAADALSVASRMEPEYVILDLMMPGESGLTLIPALMEIDPFTRIVVLTGYAGIATAVEAIKLGAVHYLAKPVDAQEILAAFERREGDPGVPIVPEAVRLDRLEWQHIQQVLERNRGNISATARELGTHRRTLQRKLEKRPRGE